ncbi:MFS transporter [Thermoflavimicrobium daqui]|uniref:MFS transporter n=1 Tax=Thermoflavimicrobium daqui TaxID=2137476 RepID=A0A364K8S2_9BACL|nr:MFS transporter [Thermoflavimicrobium daqui]RAL26600.1 hypothetical protein DL897_00680 [Thermoflavimicrobium daqui]
MSQTSTVKDTSSIGYQSLLSIPNYRNLISAQLVSDLGDGVYALALIWAMKVLTGSPIYMSMILAAEVLPFLILGIFAGIIVDRTNKKYLMLIADLGRGLIVLLLAVLWWMKLAQPWILIIAAIILSSFTAFFSPARTVAVRTLVTDNSIPYAQSLSQSMQTMIGLISPAIAGILIMFDIGLAFLLNAISFFVSYLFILLLKHPQLTHSDQEPLNYSYFLTHLKKGYQTIVSIPLIRSLLLYLILLNLLFAPISVLIPIYAQNPTQLAIIETTFIIGTLVGSILAAYFNTYRKITLIGLGVFLVFSPFAILSLFNHWILAACLLMIVGIGLSLASVTLNSLFMIKIPSDVLGRATGTIQTFTQSARPIALLSTGSLLMFMTLQNLFLVISVAGLLILLLIVISPTLRHTK